MKKRTNLLLSTTSSPSLRKEGMHLASVGVRTLFLNLLLLVWFLPNAYTADKPTDSKQQCSQIKPYFGQSVEPLKDQITAIQKKHGITIMVTGDIETNNEFVGCDFWWWVAQELNFMVAKMKSERFISININFEQEGTLENPSAFMAKGELIIGEGLSAVIDETTKEELTENVLNTLLAGETGKYTSLEKMPLTASIAGVLSELDIILEVGPVDIVDNPTIAPSNDEGNYTGGTYGCTRENYIKTCEEIKGLQKHTGLDIYAPVGTYIKSAYKGTIVEIRNSFSPGEYEAGSLGNYIIIRSEIKNKILYIKYCHLDKVLFLETAKNKSIKSGDVIGIAGTTGNAGNLDKKPYRQHTHIEISIGSSYFSTENRIDPAYYIKHLKL